MVLSSHVNDWLLLDDSGKIFTRDIYDIISWFWRKQNQTFFIGPKAPAFVIEWKPPNSIVITLLKSNMAKNRSFTAAILSLLYLLHARNNSILWLAVMYMSWVYKITSIICTRYWDRLIVSKRDILMRIDLRNFRFWYEQEKICLNSLLILVKTEKLSIFNLFAF